MSSGIAATARPSNLMRVLKISAISFLNTAPLMWDFEHEPTTELVQNFVTEYTVPSMCARALREGRADLGIIPVITTATIPGLMVLPHVAIAALNKVWSIQLISKCPIEEIRTVAVDTSSRTSVGLLQVLLTKFYGGHRELTPMPPVLEPMLEMCDAGLLIGDSAMMANIGNRYHYDLAELWHQHTGLPFVFAVWAFRRAAEEEMRPGLDVSGIFLRSRDHGLSDTGVAEIARTWAPRMGLSEEQIVHYFRDNIHYELDLECRKGLSLFFQLAAEIGHIPAVPKLEFLGGGDVLL
ncbi:MAG: menaquinone biosynthesis protein [Acidobacteriota bacterium]|nr:menaquinone biosynthesis protein [Acidobacteriota bacterium]